MTVYAMVSTAKSARYTPHALESFFAYTSLEKDDIFLLINNDGSGEFGNYPLSVVDNPKPLSFAANANRAAREALARKSDLVFLNNDVIFTAGWDDGFALDERAIIVPISNREVKYNLPISTEEIYTITIRMELEQYLGHEAHVQQIAELHKQRAASAPALLKVLCAPFYVVRIPYVVFEAIGGFDITFGAGGGEDYDFCLRAALAGFSVTYAQHRYLLHFGGKSIDEVDAKAEPAFINIFREKWGERLARLIFDDASAAVTEAGFVPYDFQREGFARIIQEIGKSSIPLRLELQCSEAG